MKKFLSIVVCFCILLTNISFALSTSAFSLKLPSDFTMISQDEMSGKYTNGTITIDYEITKNDEFRKFYKDPQELKDDASKTLGGSLTLTLLGIGSNPEVVRINNKNFLKNVTEVKGSQIKNFGNLLIGTIEEKYYESNSDNDYDKLKNDFNKKTFEDVKTITYLGTTAKNMTKIEFSGSELDEAEVDRIMSTIKLKGISSKLYSTLFYGLDILVIAAIFALFKFIRKPKKQETSTDSQQPQNFSNGYNIPGAQQYPNVDYNGPVTQQDSYSHDQQNTQQNPYPNIGYNDQISQQNPYGAPTSSDSNDEFKPYIEDEGNHQL